MTFYLHEKRRLSSQDSGAENDMTSTQSDKQLIRRIDWHLLPWLCVLYGLSLLDRFFGSVQKGLT